MNEEKDKDTNKIDDEIEERREIRDYTIRRLGHDDRWAVSCLKIIHQRSLAGDRRFGFIEQDRVFLGSIASQLAKGYKPSNDQMWWIKNKMPDYWRQFITAKGVGWVRYEMELTATVEAIWPNMRVIDWTPPEEDIPMPPDFIRLLNMAEGYG